MTALTRLRECENKIRKARAEIAEAQSAANLALAKLEALISLEHASAA
jgi:hypothetical protein